MHPRHQKAKEGSKSLDLSPLRNAITRLSEGLERYQRETDDTQVVVAIPGFLDEARYLLTRLERLHP